MEKASLEREAFSVDESAHVVAHCEHGVGGEDGIAEGDGHFAAELSFLGSIEVLFQFLDGLGLFHIERFEPVGTDERARRRQASLKERRCFHFLHAGRLRAHP